MKAYIKDIEVFLPQKKLSNKEIVESGCEWSEEQIYNKIGINYRHIASEFESSLTLGIEAAKKMLNKYPMLNGQIDYILYSTLCHEHFMLNSAAIIHNELGIHEKCAAIDFKLSCSGYITLLSIAQALIVSEQARNVLIITSDTYSKVIEKEDFGNKTIFGDAATATIVSNHGWREICKCVSGTNGIGSLKHIARVNCVPSLYDMVRKKYKDESHYPKEFFYMIGEEIFNFVTDTIPRFYPTLRGENGDIDDQDLYFVFHQANKYMLNYLKKKLGIPTDRFYLNLSNTGNTSTSSIPIALKDLMENSASYSNILCCGFGGGYTWNGTILKNK